MHDRTVGFVELLAEEQFQRGNKVYRVEDESEVTGLPDWHDRPSDPPGNHGLERN